MDYAPHVETGILTGKPFYVVRRNGWEIVEHATSLEDAQRRAAAYNYRRNVYPRLQKIGLDGVC